MVFFPFYRRAPSSVLAPFVAMPFVTSSFLLLVAMPGAPSSVLAPSSGVCLRDSSSENYIYAPAAGDDGGAPSPNGCCSGVFDTDRCPLLHLGQRVLEPEKRQTFDHGFEYSSMKNQAFLIAVSFRIYTSGTQTDRFP